MDLISFINRSGRKMSFVPGDSITVWKSNGCVCQKQIGVVLSISNILLHVPHQLKMYCSINVKSFNTISICMRVL